MDATHSSIPGEKFAQYDDLSVVVVVCPVGIKHASYQVPIIVDLVPCLGNDLCTDLLLKSE
jgi:hypothetical protein